MKRVLFLIFAAAIPITIVGLFVFALLADRIDFLFYSLFFGVIAGPYSIAGLIGLGVWKGSGTWYYFFVPFVFVGAAQIYWFFIRDPRPNPNDELFRSKSYEEMYPEHATPPSRQPLGFAG